jgi:hypothetical protein
MHCQHSGAHFRRFIPHFRRFGGYRLTLDQALNTLLSLAAHFGMRRYEKRWTSNVLDDCFGKT